MKLVIAAGGTGGHLFPAVAVAEAVKRLPDSEVLFVGSERGLEEELLKGCGFGREALSVGRLKGAGRFGRVKTILGLPRAALQARRILKRFEPDVVLGIGGYSSGPTLVSALLARIPSAILEPNAIPGLTNRLLAPFVDRIFVSFPDALRFFSRRKTVFSGTPVRGGLSSQRPAGGPEGPLTLLVLGGSQGASALNRALVEALPALEKSGTIRILHQTGFRDFEKTLAAYGRTRIPHEVFPFSHEMGRLYSEADLVIARAGASTIAELIETGRPAILVPYPFAADDHQRWNALSMTESGGGELLPEKALDGATVARKVLHYAGHREELKKMAASLEALRRPPAAETIAQECFKMSEGRGR